MKPRRTRVRAERVARTVARPGELAKRRWRSLCVPASLKAWARERLRVIDDGEGALRDDLCNWLKRKGCRP